MRTGNKNIALGHEAGKMNSGSGDVFLGYEAGRSENGDNNLYSDNSNISPPPIYGEFDNDKIIINETCEVMSDRRLKTDITRLPGSLSRLFDLNGYRYKRKSATDKSKNEIGILAREVRSAFPDIG